jgi:hypothetical protein
LDGLKFLANTGDKLIHIEGLGKARRCPLPDQIVEVALATSPCGHKNRDRIRKTSGKTSHFPKNLDAIFSGHVEIGDNKTNPVFKKGLGEIHIGAHGSSGNILKIEHVSHRGSHILIVVDDEDLAISHVGNAS